MYVDVFRNRYIKMVKIETRIMKRSKYFAGA